jgi:very-short-patch-repair endonuclease
VTTPVRTLDDLRPLLSPAQFAAALREAEFLGLPGADGSIGGATRSELEQRFLAVCRRHRVPQPAVNVKVDRFEVDFLWHDQRLVVEVDGWGSHRSRSAFEQDRARDARLAFLGYRVVRFTWERITRDARGVAKTVRSLVGAGAD